MKNFKIKHTIRTTSRYGTYDYHLTKTIEAESEAEAKSILKSSIHDFTKYKLIFGKISEV